MLVSRIPSEVIRHVFLFVLNEFNSGIEAWKHQLKLLAISRTWRAIAAPLVYSRVIIEYLPGADKECPSAYFYELPQNISFVSNIELLMSNDCQLFAKRIDINVYTFTSICTLFITIKSYLQMDKKAWPSVKKLSFKIQTMNRGAGHADKTDLVNINITKLLTLQFKQRVPNITHISATIPFAHDVCSMFVSSLFDEYSHQLVYFNSSISISPTTAEPLCSLKHFTANFNLPAQYIAPQICADIIQTLVLRNLPKYFLRNSLYSTSNIRTMNFASLKTLDLMFNDTPVDSSSSIVNSNFLGGSTGLRMCFPRLQRLYFNICPSTCALIASAEFPAKLSLVNIIHNSGIILILLNVAFKAVEWQEIAKRFIIPLEMSYLSGTNYLLDSKRNVSYSTLLIHHNAHIPDLETICWDNLTELVIDAPIQPQYLIQIINALPRLLKLEVLEVDITQDMPLDYPDNTQGSAAWVALQPFNTSIRCLRFGYFMNGYSTADMGEFAIYLVLKIPKLVMLTIPERLHESFNKVHNLAKQYPHICNICICP